MYDRLLAWPIIGLIGHADHGEVIADTYLKFLSSAISQLFI